jgi:hypothetical protein
MGLPIPTSHPDAIGISVSFVIPNPIVVDKNSKTSGEAVRSVGKDEVSGLIFSIALSIGEMASRS